MKVLLTGATSFTGTWFARALGEAGHEVVMPLRSAASAYAGVRAARVAQLSRWGRVVSAGEFGSPEFLAWLDSEHGWDVLAHHAAQVGDYRRPDFDVPGALAANTREIDRVLGIMMDRGCRRIVVTGSVFEPGEGAGSDGLPAFSPYGLSKAITSQVIAYYARRRGLEFGKFVIPNPFGPFEEPRFVAYLMKNWANGATPSVNTPDYVRDNVHADLLAACYRAFLERRGPLATATRVSPSGYVESQGRFTERLAEAMRPRLGLPCAVTLATQRDFSEPMIRLGTDPARSVVPDWSEDHAWDQLAAHYREVLGIGRPVGSSA